MKLLHLYREQAQEHPSEAKYMLVANAIAQGIEEGALAPGESLPTHRELAETLGVTIGTVSRGYAEAAQRGLTVGVTGRGRSWPRRAMTWTCTKGRGGCTIWGSSRRSSI